MRRPKHTHIPLPTDTPRYRFGNYIPTLCGKRVGLLSLYSGYQSPTWREAPLCPRCAVEELLTTTTQEDR